MPYVSKRPQLSIGVSVGTGECVALVEQAAHTPRAVHWHRGARVRGNLNLAPGTIIATSIPAEAMETDTTAPATRPSISGRPPMGSRSSINGARIEPGTTSRNPRTKGRCPSIPRRKRSTTKTTIMSFSRGAVFLFVAMPAVAAPPVRSISCPAKLHGHPVRDTNLFRGLPSHLGSLMPQDGGWFDVKAPPGQPDKYFVCTYGARADVPDPA